MTIQEKTCKLRQLWRQLSTSPEWGLLIRYELLPQTPSPLLHKRLVWRIGRLLRILGISRSRYHAQRWRVGLKHNPRCDNATPLLIICDVASKDTAREACCTFAQLLANHPGVTPVLITQLADFAFYSRLGWLVEYLPELPNGNESYQERKRRHLAWRYRNALIIPLSAGLLGPCAIEELLKMDN